MGTADIIPGVSGGTIAYILGIYARLIAAIRHTDINALRYLCTLRFKAFAQHIDLALLLPLAFGIVTAIWFFTHIIILADLIRNYPQPIYGLFFGLVLASLLLLMRQNPWHGMRGIVCIICGIIAGYLLMQNSIGLLPSGTLGFFIAGVAAISAMLLPGISGSLLLLMLGVYTALLDAVHAKDMTILLPFLLGMLVGLITTSRLLYAAFKRFPDATMQLINGLLIASLFLLWPFQPRTIPMQFSIDSLALPSFATAHHMIALAAICLGAFAIFLLHRLAAK